MEERASTSKEGQENGVIAESPRNGYCFAEQLKILKRRGWYWGDITWSEAETILQECPEGTFLVRDSRNDSHVFSVSWKGREKVLHSRSLVDWNPKSGLNIAHCLAKAIKEAQTGEANLLMHRRGEADQAEQCTIEFPLSRFELLPSLVYLCRLTLRLNYDVETLARLPRVPPRTLEYLTETRFLAPPVDFCLNQIRKRYGNQNDSGPKE